jgi:hypothetical protein
MLILLSDGAGLTSRQSATMLSRAGHTVEALSPAGLCLCRMTRHVHRVHQVPAVGLDPLGWLDAALDIATRRHAELLMPVQEQVTVMSLAREKIEAAGLLTAVPEFGALAQVQDKVSAHRTLARLGLPQPPAVVATTAAELEASSIEAPVFVKLPIGTASAGVQRVGSRDELRRLAADYQRQGAFRDGGVLVQQSVAGPLAMIQSVFAHGELIAFHACERVREGASGGASHKLGLDLPQAREHIGRLGADLSWHGALSADVILSQAGPQFIDINPRLVEPVNALASGVDLVRALVEVARSGPVQPQARSRVRPQPGGRPGVRTHQLLLAMLGAAQHGGRRDVARELRDAVLRRGDYQDSREELTPGGGDLLAGLPIAVAGLATLIKPAAWRYFTSGSTGAYSLTPDAWRQLTGAWGAPQALIEPVG